MMKGLKGEHTFQVTDDMAARHISDIVPVLSTPHMIALMEIASHKTVEPYLEEGQSTVGTYICVHHRAPAPVGSTVRVIAELLEVDRRKLRFKVEVYWRDKLIGEGEHERFVVDLERFAAKLKEELS